MSYQFAIPADVIAPGGFVRFTMRYKPSYGNGGADHHLVFFDADSRLYWRQSDAKMVWSIGTDDGPIELASDALTFAAAQELTVEVEHGASRRMITVSGATTGNGRNIADPLPAMFPPSMAYVLGTEDGGGSVLRALVPAIETLAELADERVLMQFDDTEGNRAYRDLASVLADEPARELDAAIMVRAGFDLESAVGAQLDMIGKVVDLPREGASDDRYRVFLDIQTELLLSAVREDGEWTGTAENLIRIARKFVGGAVPVGGVVLTNFVPYDFLLTLTEAFPEMSMAELVRLARFVRLAPYAGVRGVVVASGDVWSSEAVVVPHAGIWGSENVNVTGASTWGMAAE